MRLEEFIEHVDKPNMVEIFAKFLPLAVKTLNLKSLPDFNFVDHLHHDQQPTFGMYVNQENKMYVALANRHPNDILRTIAHELTHYKQDTEHQLDANSGITGSAEENQANAMAGIIMRHFNKMYPEFLDVAPITEKWSQKYKKSINCSNPKGFSQRAHCQGRKKTEARSNQYGVEEDIFAEGQVTDTIMAFALAGGLILGSGAGYIKLTQKQRWKEAYTQIQEQDPETARQIQAMVNRYMSTAHKNPIDAYIASKAIDKAITDFENKNLNKQQTTLENFADGRNPQDKGDSARHGIGKGKTIAQLKKIRSSNSASPRKKQLAHWQINMRQGRFK